VTETYGNLGEDFSTFGCLHVIEDLHKIPVSGENI
jgi:hypothetical protein